MPSEVLYRRSRFTARLPRDRLYTEAHFWLLERAPSIWRVGYTPFATRMLGDLVEHVFEVAAGQAVKLGQIIGWVEGFKAVTDLYSLATGDFLGGNPALATDPALIDRDPFGEGWLYEVRGQAEPARFDVDGYVSRLDATIDRLLGVRT